MPASFKLLSMADLQACPDALSPLTACAEVTQLPANRETLLNRISEFDAYFASLHVRLDSEVLAHAHRLKFIATPSTGLDHIDMKAAGERGIQVLSLKGDTDFLNNVTATAEMTWALLLAVVRRVPSSFEAAKQGRWARDEFRGHQLAGKTLGVLGYGRLGRMVADYGRAFRMRVLVCDINAIAVPNGIEQVDMDCLLQQSDVLSVHIHLDDKNRHLLGSRELESMKRGAILLNTSRGGIIDENALLYALRSGHLGGAGLDVIDGEWSEDLHSHPLIQYARENENLIVSPHIGGVTYESQAMAYMHMAQKLQTAIENCNA